MARTVLIALLVFTLVFASLASRKSHLSSKLRKEKASSETECTGQCCSLGISGGMTLTQCENHCLVFGTCQSYTTSENYGYVGTLYCTYYKCVAV